MYNRSPFDCSFPLGSRMRFCAKPLFLAARRPSHTKITTSFTNDLITNTNNTSPAGTFRTLFDGTAAALSSDWRLWRIQEIRPLESQYNPHKIPFHKTWWRDIISGHMILHCHPQLLCIERRLWSPTITNEMWTEGMIILVKRDRFFKVRKTSSFEF